MQAVPRSQEPDNGDEPAGIAAANESLNAAARNAAARHNNVSVPIVRSEKPADLKAARHLQHLTELAERQAILLALLAKIIDAPTAAISLHVVVNEIQQQFQCQRVALATHTASRLRVSAVSQQALLDEDSAEAGLLRDVMQAACDQQTMLRWPEQSDSLQLTDALRRLANGRDQIQLCALPLYYREELVGALLLETQDGAEQTPDSVDFIAQIGAVVAPLLSMRSHENPRARDIVQQRLRHRFAELAGPRHLAAKFLGGLLIMLVLISIVIPVDLDVIASAEVTPQERRLVTAPISGFIDQIVVRAGDEVSAGDLMLKLDNSDLLIQAASKDNEINSAQSEFRASMAAHDRKSMAVAQAQLARARAERALLSQQLARAELRAPITGYVVSDFVSGATGAPVTRGDTMLELAPDSGNEIHLLVDEHDIGWVAPGHRGQLALLATPGQRKHFTVSAIQPVAEAVNGGSRFRVIAELDEAAVNLYPGQTGVARLKVGNTSLFARATNGFTRWFRQQWWEWFG